MSERGVFALDRGWFDHPMFAREPFTEREAWAWLVSEAAFKPRKKRVGATVFELERGQLACSLRFMAEAWQWKKDKVARFLKRLETETMVATQPRHDATVITLCNYDRYQKVSLPAIEESATPDETRTRQERDKLENTKNIELDVVAVAERARPLVSEEAFKLADELAVIAGHDPKFVPPAWHGAAMRVQTWLSQGWPAEIITAAVKRVAAKKRGPPANSVQFFENAIAEEVARQSAPLPVIEVKPADKITVTKHAKTGGFDEAYHNVLDKLNAGFGGPPPEERVRAGEGETDARLLAYRRG